MFDKLWNDQQCRICNEQDSNARPLILESDHGRVCATCGAQQSAGDYTRLHEAVSDVLWFLIESHGFRVKECSVKTEARSKRKVTEWCVRMQGPNSTGCVLRWFDLFEMVQPYRGHCYSVKALGKNVPEPVRKAAEFLTSPHRCFVLTERQLSDSPNHLRFERRIQTRGDTGGMVPMCLVFRAELTW